MEGLTKEEKRELWGLYEDIHRPRIGAEYTVSGLLVVMSLALCFVALKPSTLGSSCLLTLEDVPWPAISGGHYSWNGYNWFRIGDIKKGVGKHG